MIEEFVDLIPKELLYKSGGAFFSGRRAFSELSDLYILASNPGGNPDDSPEATVAKNVHRVLCKVPENWSAYRDDCWGPNCTKNRLQRGVLHLFDRLKLDAGEIPASEVVFLCSKSLAEIPFERLAEQCWPFHQAVIDRLGVKVVVCIGKRAGKFVRRQLNAHKPIDWFSERNKRGWESHSHKSDCGIIVVTLTHASQASWTSPASDPITLVKRALIRTDTKHHKIYMDRRLKFKPIRIEGEMISDTVIKDREDRV